MIPAIFATPSKDGKNVRIWWDSREHADNTATAYYQAGRDDLMIIAAVRYCIGRMTYIVIDCADWLIAIWPALDDRTKAIIQRDIDEAFVSDDEAREEGRGYKPLGHDCDRAEWERVRSLWKRGES